MRASVVVRAKNEAASIGRALDLVRRQTVEAQLIVVDSGSTDATPQIARDHGAELVTMLPEEFTFGRSLNLGCQAATEPVVVALSAHAFLPDDDWLARMLAVFDDERVACACGAGRGPDDKQIDKPLVQDETLARAYPYWGFTNAAGGFRLGLWREHRFREDMPGTEDKEWAWHWIQRGRVCVFHPGLGVDHDHIKDPLRDLYERGRREWMGYAMYLDVPRLSARQAVGQWWLESRRRRFRSPANLARVAALTAGEWAARRGSR